MRRSTGQIDHDDGFVVIARACLRLCRQHIGQGEPSEGQPTDGEELPSGDTVAKRMFFTAYRQHESHSPGKAFAR